MKSLQKYYNSRRQTYCSRGTRIWVLTKKIEMIYYQREFMRANSSARCPPTENLNQVKEDAYVMVFMNHFRLTLGFRGQLKKRCSLMEGMIFVQQLQISFCKPRQEDRYQLRQPLHKKERLRLMTSPQEATPRKRKKYGLPLNLKSKMKVAIT